VPSPAGSNVSESIDQTSAIEPSYCTFRPGSTVTSSEWAVIRMGPRAMIEPVTSDSSGRAHVGVPPMKLSHVGKEFECDDRRVIDLELPRERDHEVGRTRVIAVLWRRELADFS